jgi:hypothetical protein
VWFVKPTSFAVLFSTYIGHFRHAIRCGQLAQAGLAQ